MEYERIVLYNSGFAMTKFRSCKQKLRIALAGNTIQLIQPYFGIHPRGIPRIVVNFSRMLKNISIAKAFA